MLNITNATKCTQIATISITWTFETAKSRWGLFFCTSLQTVLATTLDVSILIFFLFFVWARLRSFGASCMNSVLRLRNRMNANSINAIATNPNETNMYIPRIVISDAEGLSDWKMNKFDQKYDLKKADPIKGKIIGLKRKFLPFDRWKDW